MSYSTKVEREFEMNPIGIRSSSTATGVSETPTSTNDTSSAAEPSPAQSMGDEHSGGAQKVWEGGEEKQGLEQKDEENAAVVRSSSAVFASFGKAYIHQLKQRLMTKHIDIIHNESDAMKRLVHSAICIQRAWILHRTLKIIFKFDKDEKKFIKKFVDGEQLIEVLKIEFTGERNNTILFSDHEEYVKRAVENNGGLFWRGFKCIPVMLNTMIVWSKSS